MRSSVVGMVLGLFVVAIVPLFLIYNWLVMLALGMLYLSPLGWAAPLSFAETMPVAGAFILILSPLVGSAAKN